MSSSETVSVRLIFPALFNRRFEELSQKVATITPSSFVLGKIPPHITLFTFPYDGQSVQLNPLESTVTTLGTCSLSASEKQCWIGIRIKESRKLVALRQEMLRACDSPSLLRGEFLPHVTLGLISKSAFKAITPEIENEDLLYVEDIPCATDAVIYSPKTGYRTF